MAKDNLFQRISHYFYTPVDAASLVTFRICFGVIMLVEVWRYFEHGWIERYFIKPLFYFKYYGFEWVEPWSGNGMYWHFVLLGVLAFLITIGAFYRIATILFFFAFSYIFLLDQSRYLNHFYFVMILAFLLILLPTHRTFSIDALMWPKRKSEMIPQWSIWLFRTQIEIVLIYAGIVKINADWLRLEPLAMWMSENDHWLILGTYMNQDWLVVFAAYGSILLHVIGAPLLLFKRTRIPVMCLYFIFHLSNHFMFRIGIFPWLAIAATLLFLDPEWPKQLKQQISLCFEQLSQRKMRVTND